MSALVDHDALLALLLDADANDPDLLSKRILDLHDPVHEAASEFLAVVQPYVGLAVPLLDSDSEEVEFEAAEAEVVRVAERLRAALSGEHFRDGPGPIEKAAREYMAVRYSQPLSGQDGWEDWLNRMDGVDRNLRAALSGEREIAEGYEHGPLRNWPRDEDEMRARLAYDRAVLSGTPGCEHDWYRIVKTPQYVGGQPAWKCRRCGAVISDAEHRASSGKPIPARLMALVGQPVICASGDRGIVKSVYTTNVGQRLHAEVELHNGSVVPCLVSNLRPDATASVTLPRYALDDLKRAAIEFGVGDAVGAAIAHIELLART